MISRTKISRLNYFLARQVLPSPGQVKIRYCSRAACISKTVSLRDYFSSKPDFIFPSMLLNRDSQGFFP